MQITNQKKVISFDFTVKNKNSDIVVTDFFFIFFNDFCFFPFSFSFVFSACSFNFWIAAGKAGKGFETELTRQKLVYNNNSKVKQKLALKRIKDKT